MADVQPFRALHYDLDRVGGLQAVVAPPVRRHRRRRSAPSCSSRSPHNVVEIDLPQGDGDPYAHAADVFARWQRDGVLVRDDEPALWALEQDYTGPDGQRRTRHGFFARVKVEDYGPGRIRPHERTHPGPKEDRLRLTRATHANLSPIFCLYDDPAGAAWGALAPHLQSEPWARGHRRGRHRPPAVARHRPGARSRRSHDGARPRRAADRRRPPPLRDRARVPRRGRRRPRADVPGRAPGPGADRLPHAPPAHGLRSATRESLRATIERDFEVAPTDELEPTGDGPVRMGYLDAHHRRPLMLTLRDPAIVAAALPDKPEPYRAARHRGARGARAARRARHERGRHLAPATGSTTRATPTRRASASSRVPRRQRSSCARRRCPRSATSRRPARACHRKVTYFFPKVLTGMVFNPLDD